MGKRGGGGGGGGCGACLALPRAAAASLATFLVAFVTSQAALMSSPHPKRAPPHHPPRRFVVPRGGRVLVSASSLAYLAVSYVYWAEGDVPSAVLFGFVTLFSIMADGKWAETYLGDDRGLAHAADRWTAVAGTVRALCSPNVFESPASLATTAAVGVAAMYCLHSSRSAGSAWRWVAWHSAWHACSAAAIVVLTVADWRRHVFNVEAGLEPR